MIPKIIHHVWVGPRPFPADAQEFVQNWHKLLPDYDIRKWDEGNIDFRPLFIRQAYAAQAYNRVSNYARLAAVYEHGGIYLDHDMEILRTFGPLLTDECFVGIQTLDPSKNDIVNNAVIGAVPQHPFIASALRAMDAMNGAVDVGSGSGPGLLSRLLREEGPLTPGPTTIIVKGVALYPPRYFYPYEWDQDFYEGCVTDDTIGIHRWAHTWKPKRSRLAQYRKRVLTKLASTFPTPLSAIIRRANLTSRQLRSGS